MLYSDHPRVHYDKAQLAEVRRGRVNDAHMVVFHQGDGFDGRRVRQTGEGDVRRVDQTFSLFRVLAQLR